MQILYLEPESATRPNVVIKFVPYGCRCELWSWEFGQWTPKDTVNYDEQLPAKPQASVESKPAIRHATKMFSGTVTFIFQKEGKLLITAVSEGL